MITIFHSLLYRLKKDKLFYSLLAIFLIMPMALVLRNYINKSTIDSLLHIQMFFISIPTTLFVSFYIGLEYSDGTIRNKIMIGKKRYSVYLSHWLFIIVLCFLLYIEYLFVILCLGIPLLGAASVNALTIFYWIATQIITIIALVSIFTFISFVCSSRIVAIIIEFLLSIALIVVIILIIGRLSVPEYIETYQWNAVTGQMELIKILNPNYPSSTERNLLIGILYILPTAFSFTILVGIPLNLGSIVIILIALSGLCTGLGIFLFTRKDLK